MNISLFSGEEMRVVEVSTRTAVCQVGDWIREVYMRGEGKLCTGTQSGVRI